MGVWEGESEKEKWQDQFLHILPALPVTQSASLNHGCPSWVSSWKGPGALFAYFFTLCEIFSSLKGKAVLKLFKVLRNYRKALKMFLIWEYLKFIFIRCFPLPLYFVGLSYKGMVSVLGTIVKLGWAWSLFIVQYVLPEWDCYNITEAMGCPALGRRIGLPTTYCITITAPRESVSSMPMLLVK